MRRRRASRYEYFDQVTSLIDAQLGRLRTALAKDVVAFNEAVRTATIPAIVPSPSLQVK